MLEIKAKEKSKLEEVIEFYNRYLALENDDEYIRNIIDCLTRIFISKIKESEDDLEIKTEDLQNFKGFNKSCLNFFNRASIKFQDDTEALINSYGIIIKYDQEPDIIGEYILDYLKNSEDKAFRDARNVLIQNLFASKLYQAVHENILLIYGANLAIAFKFFNNRICEYEANLQNTSDVTNLEKARNRRHSSK